MGLVFPFPQRNLVRMRAAPAVSQGQASGDRWGGTRNVTARKQNRPKRLKMSSAVCSLDALP